MNSFNSIFDTGPRFKNSGYSNIPRENLHKYTEALKQGIQSNQKAFLKKSMTMSLA